MGRGKSSGNPITSDPMTTAERVEALWAIYRQLDELITPDELTDYPALEHLGDLINDLELELAD